LEPGVASGGPPLGQVKLAVYPIVGRGKRSAVVVWQF